ncbi:MAG: hypothetical protein JXR22_06920 [Prolixibacteraceae bacterium]|nr:hypothetical protein [Prolixibacteraceae bacterium]
MKKEIHIGNTRILQSDKPVQGKWIDREGEAFYVISHFDEMPPFFLSIVSHSDHWMYLSSNGSLTAGRTNPELALFPYYTDDKIHDYAGVTGSKTIIMVTINGKTSLWEPFSNRYKGIYQTLKRIYKNGTGNKIIFEEVNFDLQLTFSYSWMNSERFGWVRKSSLSNQNHNAVEINIVDGIQNILPYGINRTMQGMLSTLVDAYKKTERIGNLAIYRLSSIPVDRAEPSEALKANTVWSVGLENTTLLLSNKQLDGFCSGVEVENEMENLGTKGAYLINSTFKLEANVVKTWYLVAEVNQDSAQIKATLHFMKQHNCSAKLEEDIEDGTQKLIGIVAKADGLQLTADTLNTKRHFANILFNSMRGGVPLNDYLVQTNDFIRHIGQFNKSIYAQNEAWLNSLEKEIPYYKLIDRLNQQGKPDLIRLGLEYLPLMFSRRHGDPSRPWNLFNIQLKNSDGSPSLNYQGNWRDIFQNWEALAISYPGFLPGMIAKFLNASTIDGYNAYKITRDGIEWEVLDPDDPWSNIGYWGDHQIIYLEKLLEWSEKFFPGQLVKWFKQKLFAYANVPYQHKPYQQLLKNPYDSISFNEAKHLRCLQLEKELGADGKLIQTAKGTLQVNLAEKLLVPLLSKLSNFVPGAGIWMNTQRPEWNDANNALVGIGASMVTLYYLRRYVSFLEKLLGDTDFNEVEISTEVLELFNNINRALMDNQSALHAALSDETRKTIMDGLGEAGSQFRAKVYAGLQETTGILELPTLSGFLKTVKQYIHHSIEHNRRSDGLYHAYNLLLIKPDKVGVRHLTEMLEGQVALLSSGTLSPSEALELLNNLRNSQLYRPDQRSYTLYPNKQLPSLLQINNLTAEEVNVSALLKHLLESGNTDIVKQDLEGVFHFNGKFNNSKTLADQLNQLKVEMPDLENEKKYLLDLYEKLFDHQSFTGRSGTFYKYEGLGCIYWHMVSKLLLAVSENIQHAISTKTGEHVIAQLRKHYNEIREGIGSHKSPAEYGAFPSDPYSHTPSMMGVQQPGMTGQVKEDILTRWFELGVEVKGGSVHFHPEMIDPSEFNLQLHAENQSFFERHFKITLPAKHTFAAFSFCHIPVLYLKGHQNEVLLQLKGDKTFKNSGHEVGKEWSAAIFSRSDEVQQITVHFE